MTRRFFLKILLSHNHNDFEIFTVKHGEARLTIAGEEITLRDGESAIINPYEIHSVIAVSDAVLNAPFKIRRTVMLRLSPNAL